jgi:hypothetical protein
MARRIRGSRGTIGLIIIAAIVVTGALYAGRYIQEAFMGEVSSAIGIKPQKSALPPNPASKPPQM